MGSKTISVAASAPRGITTLTTTAVLLTFSACHSHFLLFTSAQELNTTAAAAAASPEIDNSLDGIALAVTLIFACCFLAFVVISCGCVAVRHHQEKKARGEEQKARAIGVKNVTMADRADTEIPSDAAVFDRHYLPSTKDCDYLPFRGDPIDAFDPAVLLMSSPTTGRRMSRRKSSMRTF